MQMRSEQRVSIGGTKTEEVETDDEGINPYELDMPGAKQQVMR